MSEYEKREKEDVVTIFGRKQILPALDAERTLTDEVPDTIIFEFPDGQMLEVATNQEIIIGRKPREGDPDVTIDLADYNGHKMGVSRHHAVMTLSEGYLYLEDLGSTNGTRINGFQLTANQKYRLRDGDEIEFASLRSNILFKGPDTP